MPRRFPLNVRFPNELHSLLGRVAQNVEGAPSEKSRIVRHAIRRCFPAIHDRFIRESAARSGVVIFSVDESDKESLKRLAKSRAVADEQDGTSIAACVVECVRRYLFYRRGEWKLAPADVALTGYSEAQPPPWPPYELVVLFKPEGLTPEAAKLVTDYLGRSGQENTIPELLRRTAKNNPIDGVPFLTLRDLAIHILEVEKSP